MKLRLGFVANSSSCGFIIPLAWITQEQLAAIRALCHDDEQTTKCRKWGGDYKTLDTNYDSWMIWTTEKNNGRDALCGSTDMDNGGMIQVLKKLGIPDDAVIYDSESGYEWDEEEIQ